MVHAGRQRRFLQVKKKKNCNIVIFPHRTYLKPYVTKHEDLFGAPKETNSDTLEQILKEKFLPKIISTLAERFKHKIIFF